MTRVSMRRWLAIALLWVACPLMAGDFEDGDIQHVAYPSWFKDNFLDLREDVAEARAQGKLGLMVLFTTEGCSSCAAFIQRSLGDPELSSRVRSHFDAIGLEIFSDAEMVDPQGDPMRVKAFAKRAGAGFAPTLLFYGEDGALLFRGVGYYPPERFRLVLDYLTEDHAPRMTFAAYVAGQTPALTSEVPGEGLRGDPLFAEPPYALDRRHVTAQRPLAVIFETEGCADCKELHDGVLARSEVRDLLKQFDVVQLDARDSEIPVLTPTGQRKTPSAWYAAAGLSYLPAMLLFDENGREVLRTDAPVFRARMVNALSYVLERAYEKGWTYQRFARSKAMERSRTP
ncbi:thioredoxin fold domain-containing protein [Thiorhodococcus mannitoliphagus]|uniref:Thioredoxin fold domain-containing protein n=1 Tax=Thiorhodococcus mannitoliphagus TaxID=329406 RepID=A0A6P1DYJ1_9GAMM|nr:thioredoxin fold domain-containing protein [Thiorhodococcus mannitoliphagus]NEX22153.1 thioredoxin fold domain-containing protein [Thiorhodococcus mannitoliphagus]